MPGTFAQQASPAIDTAGRAWAQLSQVRAGDRLEADASFTCLSTGELITVEQHATGLFVPCKCGMHFIEGQADDGEHLVGFYHVKQEE